jgi:hypothetical protein
MGEVYRARDTRLDRDVAIKVLPDAFAADADRRARFEREAKTVAALSHPNILAVYDFGADEGTAYAVMELLEGETCEASGYLSDVRVSRDGGRVAFFEHPKKFDDRGSVNVVDRAGKRRVLVDGFWGEQGLVWARDGNTILFLRERRRFRLQRPVHHTLAGEKRVVLEGPGALFLLDISPDGRWVVTRDEKRDGVWGLAPGAKAEQDLSLLDHSWGPILSDDGGKVLFTAGDPASGPKCVVCLRKTDGSPVVRLGEGDGLDLRPLPRSSSSYPLAQARRFGSSVQI